MSQLTDEEERILIGIANGLVSREIAQSINKGQDRVWHTTTKIKQKIGYTSLTNMVRYAIKQGLVSLDINYQNKPLGNRSLQIKKLLDLGLSQNEIAKSLGVSYQLVSTIKQKNIKAMKGQYILTDRDKHLLTLYVSDLSLEEISKHTGVTRDSIVQKLQVIKRQLKINTKADLIKFALLSNLISLDYDQETKIKEGK